MYWLLLCKPMGKMKSELLSNLESDAILHEQYWLNELFHSHEPVLPDYSTLLQKQLYEKDLSSMQQQTQPFTVHRRKTSYF